jgi:hypothetical protein
MATIDVYKLEADLKKIVKAINELGNKLTRLESRMSAVEKFQDHPKSS